MDFRDWPTLLVVDVEGNGGTPPDVIEIATAPIANGRIDDSRVRAWLIRPSRPITHFATGIHGITNSAVADAHTWADIAPEVQAELDGVWIAAHNAAAVEYRVLKAHMPNWAPSGVIDTLRLSRAVYVDAPKHNLDALIEHAGIDTAGILGQRHRAGFDAVITARLLLDLAEHFDTFSAMVAAGVPAGLPGDSNIPTRPGPETQPLW